MKNTVAIMYDFDKTLSTTDMQEFSFFPDLGVTAKEFWTLTNNMADKYEMDGILSTLLLMKKKAEEKGIKFTREYLKQCGRNIVFNKGVLDWFDRINKYGQSIGLNIKHYVISCGLKPMIEGTPIFEKFEKVFACDYIYDNDGVALWPALAINYSSKLQFLFRINKGIEKVSDDAKLNLHMEEEDRPIPQENMIYVGDGLTDVPIMKITRQCGGRSVGVYFEEGQSQYLVQDNRVDFFVKADYSCDSDMDKAIKAILQDMKANLTLKQLQKLNKVI
ncbi:MAG: haloacid dehalogenase-like hydrolase [Clostridia bacterium]|nr:haloacid dehalogenase-like hydrolase [Clostridia bacterium]